MSMKSNSDDIQNSDTYLTEFLSELSNSYEEFKIDKQGDPKYLILHLSFYFIFYILILLIILRKNFILQ